MRYAVLAPVLLLPLTAAPRQDTQPARVKARGAATYRIDPVHSVVIFRIGHFGVSRFYGRFDKVTGTIVHDQDDPARSRVEVVVDAASLDTNNAKRDRDVKGPDFLDAKQFPRIRFVSEKITPAGREERSGRPQFTVRGQLEFHGVTREVEARAVHVGEGKDPWGGYRSGYEVFLTIRRSDFGMKYMLGPVGDRVDLMLSLEGVRRP